MISALSVPEDNVLDMSAEEQIVFEQEQEDIWADMNLNHLWTHLNVSCDDQTHPWDPVINKKPSSDEEEQDRKTSKSVLPAQDQPEQQQKKLASQTGTASKETKATVLPQKETLRRVKNSGTQNSGEREVVEHLQLFKKDKNSSGESEPLVPRFKEFVEL